MKLVSDQSDDDIAYNRIKSDAQYKLDALAANMLRVLAGAGRPESLLTELWETAIATSDWALAAPKNGEYALAEFSGWENNLRAIGGEEDLRRWYRDGTYEASCAKDDICREAMRVVAGRLLGQRTQVANAENKLHDAIQRRRRALEENRAR